MKIRNKVIIVSFSAVIVLLILSPLISLFLKDKLRNRVYSRLLYNLIVDREIQGIKDQEGKAYKLFQYVIDHEFMQGTPYSCKPWESLIYAQAFCDFQSRTLNALLGIAGIPSRYAMLMDKNGVSPHTLNEVFINNKWHVFDPSMNIVYVDDKGKALSLEDLSDNFELIRKNKKIIALEGYDRTEYENFISCFKGLFPLPMFPRRSTPTLNQAHIFDYITDVYFKMFKSKFFNFYQDAYLKIAAWGKPQDNLSLFFTARNYHLAYRSDLALKSYHSLLTEFPKSKYLEDVEFFLAMLYFEKKEFSKAIEHFTNSLNGKWGNASSYYLGKTYRLTGDIEGSLSAFSGASIWKLSTHDLEELRAYRLKSAALSK